MKLSAGLLLYKITDGVLEVLIAHMGGPFWMRKDAAAWSIPKGEYEDGDAPLAVACREFEEELGSPPPVGKPVELGVVKQPSGKRITAFAFRGEFDPARAVSNHFEMEWPKGSGTIRSFPEVDKAAWVECATARTKLVKGQLEFLDRLVAHLRDQGEAVVEARAEADGER